MSTQSRISIIGIAAALLIGAFVAAAGSDGSSKVGWVSVFAFCALLAYVINWAVFIPSSRAKTEKYFDLTGSVTYLAVIVVALLLSDELDARAVIVAAKVDPLRFFMTWTLQGLWVLLTVACALAIITSLERRSIGWLAILGIALWLAGFAVEVVADQQKSTFKRDPTNKGRFISSGLWAWSRHPNYFGEIVLWTGIAMMAIPLLSGWRWVVLISPVFVALLLTRVSGIPMLETRAQDRWGEDEAFHVYTRTTPVLIPRPPRR